MGEKGNVETVAAQAPARSAVTGLGLGDTIKPGAAPPPSGGIAGIADQATSATGGGSGGSGGGGAGDSILGAAVDQVSDTVSNAGGEILGGFVGGERKGNDEDDDE